MIGASLMLDVERDLADRAAIAGFIQQGAVEVARFIGALTRLIGPRRALELGTGMGLTTYHILSNLPPAGMLDSVESDQALIEVARETVGRNKRLKLHNRLGEDFISDALGSEGYDLIFADTWPGKYFLLDEVLRMVRPGGVYVIDDMNHSRDWPDGHGDRRKIGGAAASWVSSRLFSGRGWMRGLDVEVGEDRGWGRRAVHGHHGDQPAR